MHPSMTRLLTFARDEAAPDRRSADFAAIGARIGATPAVMTNWKARGISKEGALVAQREYGCDANWLRTGEGHKLSSPQLAGAGRAATSGLATLSTGTQAHDLSHPLRRMPWKRYTWEQIMRGEDLEAEFIGAIPDDALAPDYPAGTDVVWSQAKEARTGSLLLVRDQRGGLHVRQRRQAKNEAGWCAAVIHPAYETFEPGEITIVAVGLQVMRDLP